MGVPWQTQATPSLVDVLAPDTSEIRLLVQTERGSMVHCTLPAGQITRAVRHRSVDELWYFLGGSGELWRRSDAGEEVVAVHPGLSVSIPVGTSFQFRADAGSPLTFVIVTIPPWPGEEEAVLVEGHWPPSLPGPSRGEGSA